MLRPRREAPYLPARLAPLEEGLLVGLWLGDLPGLDERAEKVLAVVVEDVYACVLGLRADEELEIAQRGLGHGLACERGADAGLSRLVHDHGVFAGEDVQLIIEGLFGFGRRVP